MNVKKYIIVDDTPVDASLLQENLKKFPFLQLAGVCPTLESAFEALSRQPIDLIILDVKLAGQSGLALLKAGITLPPVIITSAYQEFALESYEIGKTVDYLLKPFSFERLTLAVNRALMMQMGASSFSDGQYIFLKMGRKIQRFDYSSIDYIEAYGIYSKVFCRDQMHVVNERLASLTELLPSRLFVRVHKSYIINVSRVSSYDRHNLWVQQAKVPIGISYRPNLEGLLRLFDNQDDSTD